MIQLWINAHVIVDHIWLAVTTSVVYRRVPMGTALVCPYFLDTPALILFADMSSGVPQGASSNVRIRAADV